MADNYSSIPKTNTARKKVLWKDITIGDVVFVGIFVVAAFAIPFPLPFLSIIAKIIICIAICGISLLMLKKNKTTGLRMYQAFWLFCKYFVSKKKYSKNEIAKSVSQVEIVNGCIKQKFGSQKHFLKAIKIQGFNLLNSNTEEQIAYVNRLHQILLKNERFMTWIKLKESHNWKLNIENIYKKIEQLEKEQETNPRDPQEYKAKLNQLNALLEWYFEEQKNHTFTDNVWYVIVYASTIEELNEVVYNSQKEFGSLFDVDVLDLNDTANLLHNIWEPLSNSINIEETTKTIDQISPEKVSFYKDHFLIGEKTYALGSVSLEKFPIKTDVFWLYNLSLVEDTTIILNIKPLDNESSKRIIQKSINNSAYMETQFNEYKQSVQKQEYANQVVVAEQVKDDLASGREAMMNVNLYFLTYGKNSANVKNNISKLKDFLKNGNMVYNPLNFRQKDFFGNIIPNGFDDKLTTESIIFPASPFAASFPFMNSNQIDTTGCLLGVNGNNNPVVLDVNIRNNKRINSNGLILGNTGSGKTTTMKKILNNHLANDGIAFILDPEQDYVHLTHYYKGKVIDAANGNKAKINPLQILLNESDDEEENVNNNLISTHISLLMQWFKLLDLKFSEKQTERLKECILDLYRSYGFFEKNLYELQPNDYPTFTDLVEHITKIIDDKKAIELAAANSNSVLDKAQDLVNTNICSDLLNIVETITNNFLNGGIFDSLYNGISTLKIGDDAIVDFDVKNLLAVSDPNRKVAQLLLIIAYIQNAINLNGYSKHPKKALLVVDEAHLFIDAKYPDVLIFLSQMSKRIRKRSGGVWITTQNPSDFIATPEILRYTKSLMENTQYTIIQTLKPNDANAIVEMYKNTPNPITEAEKNFIQTDEKGKALIIITNRLRQNIKIDVLTEEFLAIGESPNDKFNMSKINMEIDFDWFKDIDNDELNFIINGYKITFSDPNYFYKNYFDPQEFIAKPVEVDNKKEIDKHITKKQKDNVDVETKNNKKTKPVKTEQEIIDDLFDDDVVKPPLENKDEDDFFEFSKLVKEKEYEQDEINKSKKQKRNLKDIFDPKYL